MMALLSINVNKFALLRNARGTNHPDLLKISDLCIKYGAQGITVHPRPDERHVKFADLPLLSKLIKNQDQKIEFNIEGYPSDKFCKIIKEIKPDQVTLVPDPPGALTSSFGWDCLKYKTLLIDVVKNFQQNNIRVSLFINPSVESLVNLNGMTPGMLVTLGEKKIKTLKDFADLSSDELIGGYDEKKGVKYKIEGYLEEFALTKNEADDLIINARNIVFK